MLLILDEPPQPLSREKRFSLKFEPFALSVVSEANEVEASLVFRLRASSAPRSLPRLDPETNGFSNQTITLS
jgi:hypothetical protein